MTLPHSAAAAPHYPGFSAVAFYEHTAKLKKNTDTTTQRSSERAKQTLVSARTHHPLSAPVQNVNTGSMEMIHLLVSPFGQQLSAERVSVSAHGYITPAAMRIKNVQHSLAFR